MATYSISAPDGQTYKIDGPAGASQAQVEAEVLRQNPNAGKPPFKEQLRGNIISSDVPTVVGEKVNPPPVTGPKRTMGDYVKTLYEVPATIGSALISQPVGAAYGVYKGMTSPQYGTQAGVQQGQQAGAELANKLKFQPTSPVTQDALEAVGKVAEGLPPYLGNIGKIPSAAQTAGAMKPVANNMAQVLRQAPIVQEAVQAAQPVTSKIAEVLRQTPKSTMSGVGAAEVDLPRQRYQMAQDLPVPLNLRKSMAERQLGQQKFESDIAKTYPETLGKDIIKSDMELNDAMLKNFDAFVDATGAKRAGQFNLRQVGTVVDKALVKNAEEAWTKTNKAYKLARETGEMEAPVDYAPLKQYIDNFSDRPTLKGDLAKIISIVEDEIKINDPERIVINPNTNQKIKLPPTGKMTINQLEDIYELINKSYDPETSSATYAVAMKKLINSAMEGQGGEAYQKARKLRTQYANEFENVGYVDKLLRKKPGTSDRAVALADVFDHAILKGSLEDTRNVALALKKSPEGQQAWKELQGQTIQHIKDLVTKNMTKDSSGQVTIAPKRFNSIVNELDQDGKLDYIFGKPGAQQIRNLNETASTAFDPLTGAVNYSGSGSAIIQGLERIAKATRLPGLGKIAEVAKNRELKKKVKESVNYTPEGMAKALKGKQNE
jgi:hypothetical protein